MQVTLLGCGALGHLWLAALYEQGHHCQAWLKTPKSDYQFRLTSTQGVTTDYPMRSNNLPLLQQSELLLVTLKAWQITTALVPLLPQLSVNCKIVLMHNGLGVVDTLPIIRQPLLQAITTHAAYRQHDHTSHKAWGATQLGPLNPAATAHHALADILHQALPDVQWQEEISQFAWRKLAVNSVINPLTVKYQCLNGQLVNYPREIEALTQELAWLFDHEGMTDNSQQLLSIIWHVIQSTASNTSSMLQDVQNRRLTEIDYVTGFLLKRAERHQLALPQHTALYHCIKKKEYCNAPLAISIDLPC